MTTPPPPTPPDPAPLDIHAEVDRLQGLPIRDLKEEYRRVWGEPARSNNRQHLVKRIAWRLQALQQGDLPERARRRALEIADDADLRVRPPDGGLPPVHVGEVRTERFLASRDCRLPLPGTILRREYKGRKVQVTVLDSGFRYGGKVYKSLSAVAKAVTGSHWNGYGFFGLDPSTPGGDA